MPAEPLVEVIPSDVYNQWPLQLVLVLLQASEAI